jgi:hypothetical protein
VSDNIKGILYFFSVIVFMYLLILGGRWMFQSGPRYAQGDQVTILSTKTITENGKICQKVEKGNIAYTGETGPNWWKTRAATMLFPVTDYYVVKTDGTQLWINEDNLVNYDSEKSFCSPAIQ